MGKALRWLRSLLGGGASKKTTASTNMRHATNGEARPKDEDRSLARSFRDEDRNASAGGRREVAVAAASAAVAQAAVATAQAAAAVVKLAVGTSRESCGGCSRRIGEEMAAVKIQRVFRGYLARRALKALKGVVKLQALVRGHIVRKQAAETFKCMRALLKAQARARSCRQSFMNPSSLPYRDYYLSPQAPQSTAQPNAAAQQPERLSFSQRTISRTMDSAVVDSNMLQSPSWKWLDQWMEQRYWDTQGKTTTTTFPTSRATNADDSPNVKMVEVDSVMRPQPPPVMSNARRSYTDYCPASPSKPSSHRFAASPAADGGESCDGSSHFFSASSRTRRGAFSPTTSEGSGNFLSFYAGYPNYMAYTESAKAKARSSSAPKQRAQEVEQPVPARRGAAAPAGAVAYGGSLHGGTRLEYYGMDLLERMEMEVGQ